MSFDEEIRRTSVPRVAPAITPPKQVCPVCGGRGHVAKGFYGSVGVRSWTATDCSPEKCRACLGLGIV